MKLNPFALRLARKRAAEELQRKTGLKYRDAFRLVDDVDPDDIGNGLTDLAASDPEVAFQLATAGVLEQQAVGGLGDGAILKAIVDFFKNNPELVAALVKVILMLLAV